MDKDWWKKALGEMLGAFALVVVGAGSVLAAKNALGLQGSPVLVLLYAALAHGLVIAVFATALGPISGGQISPAVTFGLWVARRQKADLSAVIIAFQLVGSVLGGFLLLAFYPLTPVSNVGAAIHLGTPALSGVGPVQGALLELVMTFFLVFVVFATAVDPRGAAKTLGGIAIGLTVGIDWFFGGAFTGAAMSPGRWIGPAVASGFFDNWWVYWVGPLLGGAIAALAYEYVFMPAKTPK